MGGDANEPAPDDSRLPPDAHGAWRIELRHYPIAHRSHAFLTLVDPSGEVRGELHGLAFSRNGPVPSLDNPDLPEKPMAIGIDGSRLKGEYRSAESAMGAQSKKAGDVAYGTYNDVVRGKWARGQQIADEINRRNLDYKGDDLSYEAGARKGGQIQNSNSAAYTYGKAMDLDLDSAIRDAGIERRFPGWGRNLVDPAYKPYVAPPMFPTENRQ
jgi:hypothetical protein